MTVAQEIKNAYPKFKEQYQAAVNTPHDIVENGANIKFIFYDGSKIEFA